MQNITPFLWFNDNAVEAAKFYTKLFKNSKIHGDAKYDEAGAEVSGKKKGSVMTVDFQLEGQQFAALNGGPTFTFTPAISFFVNCATKKEVDTLWSKLSDGGTIRMELDKYPWSERYGWTQDKFGVDWQIMLGKSNQKITPCLLFVNKRFGTAEKAIEHYKKIFKTFKQISLEKYGKNEPNTGAIKHARIALNGYEFALMDGPGKHAFDFSQATSFIINCETQKEVDHYWESLSEGGEKQPCGWLIDKHGIAWQVVPTILNKLMSDPKKSEAVMKAMLKMTKLDIKKLEQAAK